jgi:predicted O-methyltransferase YrrM
MNLRVFLGRMADVANFDRLRNLFGPVPGYLYDVEGYLLHLLAAEGPASGAIVEIGSFMGRSTCWLASGSKSTGRERIAAVDHFRGSPEHQPGAVFESAALVQEGTTYNHFKQNLTRLGLWDHVVPCISSSEELAKRWCDPVRLLFIDADHSYEESSKDFRVWSGFVAPCGLVCFHDIEVCPGVTTFYRELMSQTTEFHEIASVQSIRVIQKRSS